MSGGVTYLSPPVPLVSRHLLGALVEIRVSQLVRAFHFSLILSLVGGGSWQIGPCRERDIDMDSPYYRGEATTRLLSVRVHHRPYLTRPFRVYTHQNTHQNIHTCLNSHDDLLLFYCIFSVRNRSRHPVSSPNAQKIPLHTMVGMNVLAGNERKCHH